MREHYCDILVNDSAEEE